jgi:dTDP-4-amino-4,6-dideoxygalactose transaminase
MPVHPFGHPAALDELNEEAAKKGLVLIEDAATAIGARYNGKLVGSESHLACFSFHPIKTLTTAEGGCLVTDDEEVAERARVLRSHGQADWRGKGEFVKFGFNYRMSDVHAAIGIAQLSKLDSAIRKRRRLAKTYSELIGSSGLDVIPPVEMEWAFHAYQSYVTRLGDGFRVPRDKCIETMKQKFGIETQIGTYSLHVQPAFARYARKGGLPNGRKLFERTLTLPLYDSLTEDQQQNVVDSLKRVANSS